MAHCNAIYREGRPGVLLRFDDTGAPVRQAYRPVFEAARTHEPATGGPGVVATDTATRLETGRVAVTHLPGIEVKENRLPLRCDDLAVLLAPHDFPADAADRIEDVEVRALRLMPINYSGRRVTRENMAPDDGTICAKSFPASRPCRAPGRACNAHGSPRCVTMA